MRVGSATGWVTTAGGTCTTSESTGEGGQTGSLKGRRSEQAALRWRRRWQIDDE